MKKSKSKLKAHEIIKEDHDGTFFCLKCGQAGFRSIHQGYGHLNVCKGYDAVIQETKDKLSEIENLGGVGRSHTQHLSDFEDDIADSLSLEDQTIPPKTTNRVGHEGGGGGGGGTTHPTTLTLPSYSEEKRVRKLIEQNALLAAKVHVLEKTAFNHNQHYPQARSRQSFSGPMDIVGDVYQSAKEDAYLYKLIMWGVLAYGAVLLFEKIDKLNNKGKNNRK